ncbi:MAG: hypothetical protein SFY69_00995 [Planctomycetota bacterium]|nr:hypothetical protein [Planctomycetota bacterium]
MTDSAGSSGPPEGRGADGSAGGGSSGELQLDFEHTVRDGDGVESIAFAHGFFPDTIWEWAENEALRTLRGDMNILAAGDIVRVPKRREKLEDVATEQKHRFRRRGVPEILSVILLDHKGNPFANKPYRIVIDGKSRDGTTDAAGTVTESIPPGARMAKIIVDELGRSYEFALGGIDPITLARGVSQRLHALGYAIEDGETDLRSSSAAAAISSFQQDELLDPTGTMNDATRDALKARFGS